MGCGPVQILQNPSNVQIFQGVTMVNICTPVPVPTFLPYSFTATQNNQTVFGPFPALPLAVITLAITGTLQDPGTNTPDYTVNEFYVTLSQGIAIGNTVYGMIQVS